MLGALGVFLLVAAVVALVAYPRMRGPSTGLSVEISIADGASASDVLRLVCEKKLVSSCAAFGLYSQAMRPQVRPGPHLLFDDLSPGELLLRLERRGAATRVTFPEGFTRFDMAKRCEEKRICAARAFLEATTDETLLRTLSVPGSTAEGFLFPATYDFPGDSDPRDLVRRLKVEFDYRWAALIEHRNAELLELRQTLKWGQREVVTLASMVEKEARHDEERPLVASVFLNRLHDESFTPKLLQCDPTAGYGCLVMRDLIPTCSLYTGKVTAAIVHDASNPYSTYAHEGLPPGPIANPGFMSLEAVLSAPHTKYLFFVARGDGRHTFSETFDAHRDAVHPKKPR